MNEDNTENKGALEAVFYATASFDANGDVLSATSTVTGLKKGFYSVIEEESWTPEYTLIKRVITILAMTPIRNVRIYL